MFVTRLASPAGRRLWETSYQALLLCWVLLGVVILVNHIRVNRRRKRGGAAEEPAIRSPASMWGLAVEGLGFAVAWIFRRPLPEETAAGWILLATLLAPVSVALLAAALRHLGQQWRIHAVAAADHELVTTGPYRLVRHPVLASLLILLVSNAIVVSRWEAGVFALAIYIAGTEIRVRAEDGLLARRFPESFPAYRSRVRAYVPFIR